MARHGSRLLANGYTILPIAPGGKKPGRYQRGVWVDYPEWNRHAERPTTEVEVATWSGWPDCGIGIVGGGVAAIDIDILSDPDLALQIEQLARARLGDTPALRIGRAPKRLLVYRTSAPFRGIRRAPLEVLCLGQQFVAYADHPDTGQPYAWPEEGLSELDLESLPVIDAEMAAAFMDEALALVPPELRPASLSAPASTGSAVPGHAQTGTIEAVRSALIQIPNNDLDYDSWVRIGLAIKGSLGEAGKDVFIDWSDQAAKNDPAVTEKAWASFRPDRIGAGTIYHLAMERGWKPEPGMVLDGSQPTDGCHPASGMLARLDVAADADAVTAPASFNLTIPGGLVGKLTDYMLSTARRPQPLLSLGASLCAIGALMGRLYRTESNLRSKIGRAHV